MVLPYSNTGRTIVLYVARSVSFCNPQVVAVRALRILVAFSAFPLVILACSEKLSLGSNVKPSILGVLTVELV